MNSHQQENGGVVLYLNKRSFVLFQEIHDILRLLN